MGSAGPRGALRGEASPRVCLRELSAPHLPVLDERELAFLLAEGLAHVRFSLLLGRKRGPLLHLLFLLSAFSSNNLLPMWHVWERHSATLHRGPGNPVLMGHLADMASQVPACHTDTADLNLILRVTCKREGLSVSAVR